MGVGRWRRVVLVVLAVACAFEAPRRRPAVATVRPVLPSDIVPAESFAAAVFGGVVGVVGSCLAIESKKARRIEAKRCPYCTGSGSKINETARALGSATCQCQTCAGQGKISCQNCKGRGQFIPTILDRTISRDPESEYEEVGLQ